MASLKSTVKAILDNDSDVYADKLTARKDGTVEVKRGYFYRHGMTSDQWAQRVQAALDAAGCTSCKVVDHRDDWREWPKDSEFVAVISAA